MVAEEVQESGLGNMVYICFEVFWEKNKTLQKASFQGILQGNSSKINVRIKE